MDRPMCCPNPVHETEPGAFDGMYIIPERDTVDVWYCMDCKKKFRYFRLLGETKSEMLK